MFATRSLANQEVWQTTTSGYRGKEKCTDAWLETRTSSSRDSLRKTEINSKQFKNPIGTASRRKDGISERISTFMGSFVKFQRMEIDTAKTPNSDGSKQNIGRINTASRLRAPEAATVHKDPNSNPGHSGSQPTLHYPFLHPKSIPRMLVSSKILA